MAASAASAAPSSAGEIIDTARIPGGSYLDLVRHGDDYEILFDGEQLMGSWDSRSEEALATIVCGRLNVPNGRILIGGLGMGFTLGAALAALPRDATIVVAELVPQVVDWARGTLTHLFAESLADSRASIHVGDVHDVIVAQPGGFDAILLDVDNGPEGLISLANERLYCNWGLRAAHRALRPGGMLAVWSSYPDPDFFTRLQAVGFAVEEIRIIPSDPIPGGEHVIWIGTRPAD